MRVLFSTVPGYGHLLPMAPLMQAAVGRAHHVGLLVTDDLRPIAVEELDAAVELLPIGARWPSSPPRQPDASTATRSTRHRRWWARCSVARGWRWTVRRR